jgi:hypothetical protein
METTGSFVDIYQYFGRMYCLHLQGRRSNPEGRDRMFLRNVDTYLPNSLRHTTASYSACMGKQEGGKERSHGVWNDP